MQKYCTIYLVRHGETDWNVKKLIQGHLNILLNEKGKIQAKKLAEKLTHVKFNAVFSSDLIRAKKTAEIIVLEKKLTVITTKALRERYFGHFQGKHIEVLKQKLGEQIGLSKKSQKKYGFEDVENDEEIIARFISYLREIAVAYPKKNVLVIAHGGVMRVLFNHLGYAIPNFSQKIMKNTGYAVIDSDGVDFIVKEENLFHN